MTGTEHPASIHLWSSDFASQQLAFAHLLDAADRMRTALDLDAVEVIPVAEASRRLTPYLGSDLPDLPGPILVLLAAPPGAPAPFTDTEHLRYLGTWAGRVLRAGAAGWA
jgi:hypothetical protein